MTTPPMTLTPLPIDQTLPALLDALRSHPNVVIQAPTGAGKTTRVPVAIDANGLASGKLVVMLEPRRIAARAAARRMAEERGERLGASIGYHVRFDRQASRDTRVLVVTEGLLLRMLLDDPYLERVGAVVFDEFHERSLDTDLALGMTRLLQATVRPDLRLVVMSATLAAEAAAKYLDDAPILVSQGRLYPVDIAYAPRPVHQPWGEAIRDAVDNLLARTPGDILVFLPGVGEIRQAERALATLAQSAGLAIAPLFGDLPAEAQDAALRRGNRRRVILATNVAETSVTVDGVTGVIDTGLARINRFDPQVGLNRLELAPISQASAEQRAGRAGRLAPGHCVRLWSAGHHQARAAHNEPEIQRVDLSGAVLQLAALGESDPAQFPWLDPPRPASVQQAQQLLESLEALAGKTLTPLGRLLAQLPVHPRLGRLLIEGHRFGCLDQAALAAALLAERDPFAGPDGGRGRQRDARPTRAATRSDLWDRVEWLEEFSSEGRADTELGQIQRGPARQILQARDQLVRQAQTALRSVPADNLPARPLERSARPSSIDEALARALLAAFPDRVAKRREPQSPRALLVGGRGVRLDPRSAVTEAELFLCLDVDAGQGEAVVRVASAIEREWLPHDSIATTVEAFFDEATGRVAARRRTRFVDLLLDETTAPLPPPDQVAAALVAAAVPRLDQVLPPPDSDAGKFLARVQSLREWMPDLGLPAWAPEELAELLPQIALGRRSLTELRDGPWLEALRGAIDPRLRQTIEREAPARIETPSGNQHALVYERGRPPVLAVRIQEVFGWRDTPRIAGGRVRVLLHLLGPNFRPQQVTDDLASFWANGYPVVRKELRRRYPKHAWPDDPLVPLPRRPR